MSRILRNFAQQHSSFFFFFVPTRKNTEFVFFLQNTGCYDVVRDSPVQLFHGLCMMSTELCFLEAVRCARNGRRLEDAIEM